jgi:hypothetical protein
MWRGYTREQLRRTAQRARREAARPVFDRLRPLDAAEVVSRLPVVPEEEEEGVAPYLDLETGTLVEVSQVTGGPGPDLLDMLTPAALAATAGANMRPIFPEELERR